MADQASEGLFSPMLSRWRARAARPFLAGRILDVGCGNGALAATADPDHYVGVDRNPGSLALARQYHPRHVFRNDLPSTEQKFDTVVGLAIIEHVSNPAVFLAELANFLNESSDARIVLTTPHPSMEWLHHAGSSVGLFSRHAYEEHEELLDKGAMQKVCAQAQLEIAVYQRFMFRANQLVILKPPEVRQLKSNRSSSQSQMLPDDPTD